MGRGRGGNAGNRPDNSTGRQLSERAHSALEYYVDGNAYNVNDFLRFGSDMDKEDEEVLKGLDEATNRTLEAQTLYRGVDIKAIFGNVNLGSSSPKAVLMAALNGNVDVVRDKYDKLMGGFRDNFTDKGFMSLSKSSDVAETFGSNQSVILKVSVPKGTKGLVVPKSVYKAIGNNASEQEVILKRNQKLKLGKMYLKGGKIYIDATISR